MVLKTIYPDAEDILGIATEDKTAVARSEDAVYLDARVWSEELQSEALSLQEEFDILRKCERSDFRAQEYTDAPTGLVGAPTAEALRMKGRQCNLPCPRGSGRNVKRCCGRSA